MNAMSSASDNAKDLKKKLSTTYNRKRQAKITSKAVAPLPPCQLLRFESFRFDASMVAAVSIVFQKDSAV